MSQPLLSKRGCSNFENSYLTARDGAFNQTKRQRSYHIKPTNSTIVNDTVCWLVWIASHYFSNILLTPRWLLSLLSANFILFEALV